MGCVDIFPGDVPNFSVVGFGHRKTRRGRCIDGGGRGGGGSVLIPVRGDVYN